MKSRIDGSTAGDQNTGWTVAGRSGLAAKSQPPSTFVFLAKRLHLRFAQDKTVVKILVGLVATKAFPGKSFDVQPIEEVVTAAISPARCVRLHPLNSSLNTRKSS